ncbi:hypothetical protein [Enterococcus thailandicus]|uniref:hypothetical protein n=1 Tax=Enterococcus thailandicus TaxID=417368 RepID=UPI0022E0A2D3|nr:hypothetical protein [Enterococcus thailandicus]
MNNLIFEQINYLYQQALDEHKNSFSVPMSEICSNPKTYVLQWAKKNNIKVDIMDSWGSVDVVLL